MQQKTICSIATTLYPSYREGLTSPASNKFIEMHLQECSHCRKFFHIPEDCTEDNAADTSGTDDAAEISYLRYYRRLFSAAILGVFSGILIFALLIMNIFHGSSQLFKLATRQHSVRSDSITEYHQWKDYQGISDFSIFPENLSDCLTINDYYYQCDSSSFLTALQLYLDCSYTPKDYEMEKQRLMDIARPDMEQSLFAQPACYTILFSDTACEYVIFLEEEHRILYISLENISRDEIVFDESYLPLDYGNFGTPPENQAKPFCIYQDNGNDV